MSNQQTMTSKEELLEVLQDLIKNIESINDSEIEKRDTKLNVEKGTGYYLSNNHFHLWLVKLANK